jgi:hypothetical protein
VDLRVTDRTYGRSPGLALAARLALAGSSFALAGCASTASPSLGAFWSARDTPGAALAITEIHRSGSGFATVVTYELATRGLPPGDGYQIAVRRADGTSAMPIDDAVVASTGEVGSKTSNAGETMPIAINAKALAPGEPIEIRVRSAALGTQATAEITPRLLASPIEAKCQLTARLERRPTLAYRVALSGFQRTEPVEISIRDAAGRVASTSLAGSHLAQIVLHRVLKEPTTLSIVAASPSCRAEAVADFADVPR